MSGRPSFGHVRNLIGDRADHHADVAAAAGTRSRGSATRPARTSRSCTRALSANSSRWRMFMSALASSRVTSPLSFWAVRGFIAPWHLHAGRKVLGDEEVGAARLAHRREQLDDVIPGLFFRQYAHRRSAHFSTSNGPDRSESAVPVSVVLLVWGLAARHAGTRPSDFSYRQHLQMEGAGGGVEHVDHVACPMPARFFVEPRGARVADGAREPGDIERLRSGDVTRRRRSTRLATPVPRA